MEVWNGKEGKKSGKKNLQLHVMMLPTILFLIVFSYVPMVGIIIAFQKFNPAKGLFGKNKWIGLENFRYIFSLPNTKQVVINTLVLSVSKIVIGTLLAIAVALLLNECRNRILKKSVQTIIYFPYFISWIILAGMIGDMLSPSSGILNQLITALGGKPIYFLGDNRYFRTTLIISDLWKTFGYNSVIYLAAITGIDSSLYEAAAIDGAGRWKQILYVTLPGMSMIIILMSVLNMGNILNAGFDQVYNLYSPGVYEGGDIIDTMVYRMGIEQGQLAPSAAVGLLKSVVSLLLIAGSYYIADKKFDYKIF